MNTLIQFTVAAALILSIILPMGYFLLGAKTKKRYKKSLAFNCFGFFGALLVGSMMMFAGASSVHAAAEMCIRDRFEGFNILSAAYHFF